GRVVADGGLADPGRDPAADPGAWLLRLDRATTRSVLPPVRHLGGRVGWRAGDRGGRPVRRLQGRADFCVLVLVVCARGRSPFGCGGARHRRGADGGRTSSQLRRLLSPGGGRRVLRGPARSRGAVVPRLSLFPDRASPVRRYGPDDLGALPGDAVPVSGL